jgi:hypothetical protein
VGLIGLSEPVMLALIALGGTVGAAVVAGPVMFFLKRFDGRNTSQHGANMQVLNKVADHVEVIHTKVDRLDQRLDTHLDWHLQGVPDDERNAG